jgi:hypothetical protein
MKLMLPSKKTLPYEIFCLNERIIQLKKFCMPTAGILFAIICAERATTGAILVTGLRIDSDDRPRVFHFQVGFKMNGKIVGVQDCC